MDDIFRAQILRLKSIDSRLDRLYQQHQAYEAELSKLSRRGFLTAEEEDRVKTIKFAKARGKEEMANIIADDCSAASAVG